MTEQLEEQLEHNLVPCDMYRVCPNYEAFKCENKDFKNQCRKLDDYYWKGGEN